MYVWRLADAAVVTTAGAAINGGRLALDDVAVATDAVSAPCCSNGMDEGKGWCVDGIEACMLVRCTRGGAFRVDSSGGVPEWRFLPCLAASKDSGGGALRWSMGDSGEKDRRTD